MIEGRAIVKSIKSTKESVESLGGQFNNHYILKDVIFVPKKQDYNLNEGYVRLRVNIKSSWPSKKISLVKKQIEFKATGKIDKITFRKEFDSEEEASEFIEKTMPEFQKGFEYERDGWQYILGDNKIFIEDIQGWKPSIEIETEKEEEIKKLFDKIGILKLVKSSVPEIMKDLL